MSAPSSCTGNTGDEPPCITSPLKSYPRENAVQNKEDEAERVDSINGSGDHQTGFVSPRKLENDKVDRPRSRSPRRRSPKRRSRSRSPRRRSRSHSPANKSKMCDEVDGWEKNEYVFLDTYNCDLNMVINSNYYGARPQTDGGFSMMWAGVRASFGYVDGKIFYEVRIVENITVDNLDSLSGGATHVVRVGWSTEDSLFALGEEANSYGYGGTGKKSCDNKFEDYGCTFSEGDVVGAFLELTANEAIIRFSVNGVDQGECYRVDKSLGARKPLFPHIYVKNVEFCVNFGQEETEPWFTPNIPGDNPITWHQLNQTDVNSRVRGRLPPSSKAECEAIMMVGLPGAGKTYYADKLSNEHRDKQYNILGTNYILDKMKVMGLARQRNYSGRWDVLIDKATKCLNVLINAASNRRRNYILDQTNVYPSAQRRKMRPFEGFKRRAIVIVPTDEEFRRRITQREKEEGKEVPESAVLEMKANFGIPKAISDDSTSVFDEVEFTELDSSAASTLVKKYNDEGQAGRPPPEKRQRWESRDRDGSDSRWSGGFDRDRSRDFGRGRRDDFSRSPRRDDRGRRDYRGGYSAQRDGREDRFDRSRDRDSYGRPQGGRFNGGPSSGRFGGPPPSRGGYAPNIRGGYGGSFDGGMSRGGGRGGMNRGGGNFYGYDMNRGPPGDFRGGPRGGRGGYRGGGGGGSMDSMYHRGGPPSYGHGPAGPNDQSYDRAYSSYSGNSGRGGPNDSGRGEVPASTRGMGASVRGVPPASRGAVTGGPRGNPDPSTPYGATAYPSSMSNYPPSGRSQYPSHDQSYPGSNQQKSSGGGYPSRTGYSESGYQRSVYPDDYSSAPSYSGASGYGEGAYPPGTNPPSNYPPQDSYSSSGSMRGSRGVPPSASSMGMFGGGGESVVGTKSGGQSAEHQAAEGVNQHISGASRFGGDRQPGARQSRFEDAKGPSAQNMYQQNPYSYSSGGYQSSYGAGGYGSSGTAAPPSKGVLPTNQPASSKSNRSQFDPVPPIGASVSPAPMSQQSMATQGYGYGYQQSKPESTGQTSTKQQPQSTGAGHTANYNSAYGYGYTYGAYGGGGGGSAATALTGASRTPPSGASAGAPGSASLYASAVADKTTQAHGISSNTAQKQATSSAGGTSMAYASYYGYGGANVPPPHPGAPGGGGAAGAPAAQQYSAWQQTAVASVPTTNAAVTMPSTGQAAPSAASAASVYSNYYAAYPGYAAAYSGSTGAPAGSNASAQQTQQQQYYAGYR